jgi:antitoxin MazE
MTPSSINASLQQWGNSLAVRIPKAITEEMNLVKGASLRFRIEENRIILEPDTDNGSLANLLENVTPENLHRATDWGEARGNEVW